MPSPLVLTAAAAIAGATTPAVAPVVEQVVAPVVAPALAPGVVHSCAGGGRAPATATSAEVRSAVLCLLNRQRALHGLAPLHGNARLRRAGWGHARDMVVHRYFAHDSRNG